MNYPEQNGLYESTRANQAGTAGQAMVELAVAIVVILVLFAGLLQAGRLANARTRTMIEAREIAAQAAMSEAYGETMSAVHILNWTPGPDGRTYTSDDFAFPAPNAEETMLDIISPARPEVLGSFVAENDLLEAYEDANAVGTCRLVHGRAHDSIPTFPVIRSLVYNRPSISVESDVWLVWTRGID